MEKAGPIGELRPGDRRLQLIHWMIQRSWPGYSGQEEDVRMPNLFDLLIIALFGGTVLLSFMGGLGKVFSTLAGLYGGALIAALFYQTFSEVVLRKLFSNMADFTGQLVAFLFLMLWSSLAIAIGLGRSFFLKKLGQRIGVFNNITGGTLGIAVAIFATILATMITSLLLQLLNATAELGSSPTVTQLQTELGNSLLVPLFLKLVPAVVFPLQPFFPSGLPPILASGGF
jgi:uncharacterized membrane protein required for colicin V production